MENNYRHCAACGMEELGWDASYGEEDSLDNTRYCCQGCAEGTGCTCYLIEENRAAAELGVESARDNGKNGSSRVDRWAAKGKRVVGVN